MLVLPFELMSRLLTSADGHVDCSGGGSDSGTSALGGGSGSIGLHTPEGARPNRQAAFRCCVVSSPFVSSSHSCFARATIASRL